MKTLKELMRERGVTDEHLAKLCGVQAHTVHLWALVTGRTNRPGKKSQRKLEAFFGCPIHVPVKENKKLKSPDMIMPRTHATVVHANPDGDIVYDYNVQVISERYEYGFTKTDVEAVHITSGDRAGERWAAP